MYYLLVVNLFIGFMAARPIRPERCNFLADPGPCHKNFPVFAYDTGIDRCIDFTYGGCGGNPNRFSSKHRCREVCNAPLDYEDDFISNEWEHKTHKATTLKESTKESEAEKTPEDKDLATEVVEPSSDSIKGYTEKTEVFTLFNVLQIDPKQ